MAKKQPAKPEEYRAGNEHVSYPADPADEALLSPEQIRRHKGLADEAREAKREGDLEGYDAIMGIWRDVPGYGTNTVVRGMMVRVDAVPIGTTTIHIAGSTIGAGEKIETGRARFKPGPCPKCESPDTCVESTKKTLRYLKCKKCGETWTKAKRT